MNTVVPLELQHFLLGLMSPSEFRDWLYAQPEVIESWLHPDDYLAVLELDYSDWLAVSELRKNLGPRFVPLAPLPKPAGGAGLMSAIHRAPDDPSNYLVLSDQLQLENDPRGQLIALQANSQRRGSYFIDEAADQLLREHTDQLLGPAAQYLAEVVRLDWFLGFVARAVVRCDYADVVAAAVESLFTHPSFELLREVAVTGTQGHDGWQSAVERLGQMPESRLPVLRLGIRAELDYPPMLGSLGSLWRTFPQLRVLEINGYAISFGKMLLPELVSLTIHTDEVYGDEVAAAMFEHEWPALKRLELRMRGERAPWTELAGHALLTRLSALEIDLDEAGFDLLVNRTAAFEHLRELVLHVEAIFGPEDLRRLRAALPRAVIR